MPNYNDLFKQGIYDLANGVRVFAGTVDDPFYIDLGAAFDSLNFRMGVGGVLPAAEDADDTHNYAPDAVAGFNVNSIVLEVPITMLTVDGKTSCRRRQEGRDRHLRQHLASARSRSGVTAEPSMATAIRAGQPRRQSADQRTDHRHRIQRPFQHGRSGRTIRSSPASSSIRCWRTCSPRWAFRSPPPPRTDLLPLVQYRPPICPGCGPNDAGPIADLLRLNTGIPPTPVGKQKRLGFLAGDIAGFPNGRRPIDDVVDIASRAVAGILVDPNKYGTRDR